MLLNKTFHLTAKVRKQDLKGPSQKVIIKSLNLTYTLPIDVHYYIVFIKENAT